MADKKLTMAQQRQSLVDAVNGKKPEQDAAPAQKELGPIPDSFAIPNPGISPEEQMVAAAQAQNQADSNLSDKLQATNSAVQRYNQEMQRKALQQKLMAIPAVQQQMNPADNQPAIGQSFPANEQDALKQALMRRLAGQQ